MLPSLFANSILFFLFYKSCLGDDESVIILWQLKPTQPGESAAPRLFDDDAGENKAGFIFYLCIIMQNKIVQLTHKLDISFRLSLLLQSYSLAIIIYLIIIYS